MGSSPFRPLRLVRTGALGAGGRSARAGWRAGGQKWRTVGWSGIGQALLSMYALTDLSEEPSQKDLGFLLHTSQVFLRPPR